MPKHKVVSIKDEPAAPFPSRNKKTVNRGEKRRRQRKQFHFKLHLAIWWAPESAATSRLYTCARHFYSGKSQYIDLSLSLNIRFNGLLFNFGHFALEMYLSLLTLLLTIIGPQRDGRGESVAHARDDSPLWKRHSAHWWQFGKWGSCRRWKTKKKNIFGRNVVTLWNDEMVQVTDYTFFSKIVNRMQMRLSIR